MFYISPMIKAVECKEGLLLKLQDSAAAIPECSVDTEVGDLISSQRAVLSADFSESTLNDLSYNMNTTRVYVYTGGQKTIDQDVSEQNSYNRLDYNTDMEVIANGEDDVEIEFSNDNIVVQSHQLMASYNSNTLEYEINGFDTLRTYNDARIYVKTSSSTSSKLNVADNLRRVEGSNDGCDVN